MDEAIVVFSRKGIFQTTIAARDVRGREHARRLWPLAEPINRLIAVVSDLHRNHATTSQEA